MENKKNEDKNTGKNEEENNKISGIQEISDTFQRENEKILVLETEVKGLSEKISLLEKKTEKKTSFIVKIIGVFLLGLLCFSGYWFYNQEDKMKALDTVGGFIIEKKNMISQKITQASTNLSNAEIQAQIDALKDENTRIQKKNTYLEEVILSLSEIAEKKKKQEEEQKKFHIQQLQDQIDFLSSEEKTKISEDIIGEEKEEKIESIEIREIPQETIVSTDDSIDKKENNVSIKEHLQN